ncbi:hypothetical protein KI387_028092, partial [Taxus chinensis]
IGTAKVYIYLKPKLENGKYVENKFKLAEVPKGNHTMDTLHDEENNFPLGEEEEEEEEEEEDLKEDNGVLEHR